MSGLRQRCMCPMYNELNINCSNTHSDIPVCIFRYWIRLHIDFKVNIALVYVTHKKEFSWNWRQCFVLVILIPILSSIGKKIRIFDQMELSSYLILYISILLKELSWNYLSTTPFIHQIRKNRDKYKKIKNRNYFGF